jgi:hypothetical protein
MSSGTSQLKRWVFPELDKTASETAPRTATALTRRVEPPWFHPQNSTPAILAMGIGGGDSHTTAEKRRCNGSGYTRLPDCRASQATLGAGPLIHIQHRPKLILSAVVKRKKPFVDGDRGIGAISCGIKTAIRGDDLRGSLLKKANRYGALPVPYVIAATPQEMLRAGATCSTRFLDRRSGSALDIAGKRM